MKLALCTIGGVRVRLDVLFIPVTIVAFIAGEGDIFLLTLLSLALHEAAHTAMAGACGIRVSELTLCALGMSAKLERKCTVAADEFAIALSGPLFSLTAAIAAGMASLAGLVSGGTVKDFALVNAALFMMNLLPAPPLDGSAMLTALLRPRFGERAARLTVCICGFALSALSLALAVKLFVAKGAFYLPAAFALLSALSAWGELRAGGAGYAAGMLDNGAAIRGAHTVGVRHVAVGAGLRAADAMSGCKRGAYTRFIVLDADMRELGSLGEGEMLDGIARFGAKADVGSLLRRSASVDRRA